jgi:hypothetical protein
VTWRCAVLALLTWAAAVVPAAAQQVLRVGPKDALRTVAAAAAKAQDGDVIEVAAGDYPADVAVWSKDRITVRGVGGRVRLIAAGASAEQKAIWVVRGGLMTVENIEFVGARVADLNGAGIRFEKGHLIVRNCLFSDNENGILTGNDKAAELEIEGSEFGNNGAGDGRSHNLYVGGIRKLTVTGCYSHHARSGHLLKSRAAENYIAYNRLTDETGGHASYELEFPSGGVAYVIGNIIQQGSQTENPHLISFGIEGYAWPRNELYLVNNTLVDDRPSGGIFLRVKPGAGRVKAVDNLLLGKGQLDSRDGGEYASNFNVDYKDFALAVRQDYRVKSDSRLVGKEVDPGEANGVSLAPTREYVHPRQTRPLSGKVGLPGALQSLAP